MENKILAAARSAGSGAEKLYEELETGNTRGSRAQLEFIHKHLAETGWNDKKKWKN
jgi:hypothetical protein